MTQVARPTSDLATGQWGSTPLWSKINDGSDSTEIESANNQAVDACEFTLDELGEPNSNFPRAITIRVRKSATGGHTVDVRITLKQGAVTIATGDFGLTLDTLVTRTLALSPAEFDTITDWTDLNLLLARVGDTGGPGGNRRSIIVTQAEAEFDDTTIAIPGGSGPVSTTGALTAAGRADHSGSVSISGEGALTAEGLAVHAGDGEVAATSDITAAGQAPAEAATAGSGTVAGEGTLTAVGAAVHAGSGTTSATSDITAAGLATHTGTGEVSTEGGLTAAGLAPTVDGAAGSGTVSATSSIEATGRADHSGTGEVSAESTLTAEGRAPGGTPRGHGTVSAESSIEASGYAAAGGAGEVSDQGALEGSGYTLRFAGPTVSAEGTWTAQGRSQDPPPPAPEVPVVVLGHPDFPPEAVAILPAIVGLDTPPRRRRRHRTA